MRKSEYLQQAHTILSVGRIIHNRVMRIYADHKWTHCNLNLDSELTFPQVKTIMATHEREAVTIKNLSQMLGISSPSASTMVDRLVEMGILTREQDPEDRRRVVVQVSPKAQEDIREMEKALLESFLQIAQKLGPENTKKWVEILLKVGEAIAEEEQH